MLCLFKNTACQSSKRVTLGIPVALHCHPWISGSESGLGGLFKMVFLSPLASTWKYSLSEKLSILTTNINIILPPQLRYPALLRKENLCGMRWTLLSFNKKPNFQPIFWIPSYPHLLQTVCSCCYYPYYIGLLILHLYSLISISQCYSTDTAFVSVKDNLHAARPNEHSIVINSICLSALLSMNEPHPDL